MPLKRKAQKNIRSLALPLSYRTDEKRERCIGCLNVYAVDAGKGESIRPRLDTRFGTSLYMDTQASTRILSLSFFKKTDNTRKVIAKIGTSLYSVATSGAHTEIKTSLTAGNQHRGLTLSDRHIISVESDGLFQWNGTTFTRFGVTPPAAPSVAAAASGSLPNSTTYKIYLSFYSSTTGFESAPSVASSSIATDAAGNNTIAITSIPATSTNATVDTVFIYVEDTTNDLGPFFVTSVSLGTTSYNYTTTTTSTNTYKLKHDELISGGGKYLAEFNNRLVVAGNPSFPNDIFFSEQYHYEGFDSNLDTQNVQVATGEGSVTGIATGFFDDSTLSPYLAVFKKNATWIYSEVGGSANFIRLDGSTGCINDRTIHVYNGNVIFMSLTGWKVLVNGRILSDKLGNPVTLGNGDIDDIFRSKTGFAYELNFTKQSEFHSVYYPELDHYMTFISEGTDTAMNRAYVYQVQLEGFTIFDFSQNMKCSVLAEDSNGNNIVLLADDNGWLYKYSSQESKTDTNYLGDDVTYQANVLLPWIQGDDLDSSYNFRELIVRALINTNNINVSYWVNYNFQTNYSQTYSFADANSGFILDVSKLDEGILADNKNIITARNDLNVVGENILIGFFQEVADGNLGLISAQLDVSKNGNRN